MAGKVDLKVVLLGKEYGGKTSLVERYIHGKFNSNAPYQSVSQLQLLVRHILGGVTAYKTVVVSNFTSWCSATCKRMIIHVLLIFKKQ